MRAMAGKPIRAGFVLLVGVSLLGLGTAAMAATVQAPGSAITPGALGISGEVTDSSATGSGANPTLTLPGSYNYGNTLGAAAPGGSGTFYDAYVFTLDTATASSVTTTINLGSMLGITSLQEELYNTSTGASVPFTGSGAPPGATTYYDASASLLPGGTGEVAVLQSMMLTAGTYVLEISGTVSGTSGGSYAGVLDVAPVPLPAAFPLLLSGLGILGGALRRRRLDGT